ncbi:MAG: RagB/SusD family nutrient uptake outer membrane protein [Cyclobacteriaceae bacterium]
MKTISSSINLTKIAKSLAAVWFLLAAVSCQDNILEETPRDIVAENYYKTASELETAVNAVYSPLRTGGFIGSYIAPLDAHTEWGFGRGSRAVFNDFQGLNTTWANSVGTVWGSFYLSIRNANFVLANAPGATAVSAEDKARFIAEARFLRAYNYFQLVRNWGAVPIRTEENMEEKDVPRSSVPSVYELIVADLRDAEENLPEDQSLVGRPTKYAAKTMLADAYLHLEMYDEARDLAKEVMDSNKYSLVPVETPDDFATDIWGPDVVTTAEEIFFLKFARQLGQGNFMGWVLNHPSTGLFNFGGAYAHYSDATIPFYKNWSNDDLRKGLWNRINFGLGDSTLVSRKFVDQSAASQNDAGMDHPVYRYSEVLLIYAEAAARAGGGPTPEAVEALNKVHRRAYGEDQNSPSSFDFNIADYNEDSFVDQVIEERGYEFIFEGKRWFTLKRTNKAAELVLLNRGKQIAEKHYLWPIPLSELNFNDAINAEDQNPGY